MVSDISNGHSMKKYFFFGAGAATIYFAFGVINLLLQSPDDTDPPDGSLSGLRVFTDNRTGCQYLKAGSDGGLTPRLDENGRPMCRRAPGVSNKNASRT